MRDENSAPEHLWIDTFCGEDQAPNWPKKPIWDATKYTRADTSDAIKAENDRLNSVLNAIMCDAAWTPKHPACEKIMQRIKELRADEAKP